MESGRPSDAALGRALALVRYLRIHCPWDARQDPRSLRPYLLEEAHETADAINNGLEAVWKTHHRQQQVLVEARSVLESVAGEQCDRDDVRGVIEKIDEAFADAERKKDGLIRASITMEPAA